MTDVSNSSSSSLSLSNRTRSLSAVPMSSTTSSLEHKLRLLREEANKHSQILTQKLASSPSGQNLLHIGSSLSTLPPDLHTLLSTLHPMVSAVEQCEQRHLVNYQQLVQQRQEILSAATRVQDAKECAELYRDFCAAERHVQRILQLVRKQQQQQQRKATSAKNNDDNETEKSPELNEDWVNDLDSLSMLERSAHTTLFLVQELKVSTEIMAKWTTTAVASSPSTSTSNSTTEGAALLPVDAPLLQPTERAQFIMKLTPRIRRLKSDTLLCLLRKFE